MIVLFDKKQQRIPLKIWTETLDQIDGEALKQAINLTKLPFAYKQVALMPDVHTGYGMPIGGVLAAEETIIPYAVGMDIGCGMHAALTSYTADQFPQERVRSVLHKIKAAIPLGFQWHQQVQKGEVLDRMPLHLPLFQEEEKRVRKQLGTLGGGNHFIELQKDPQNRIWVMIHSGSRNIGKQTAEFFHKRAKEVTHKLRTELPTSELSFLPLETQAGQDYLDAMNWCLDFARENRQCMMDSVMEILESTPLQELDIHHNYAAREKHFGRQVWIHRKGATLAADGELGIIPGSMGSSSYIVRGKGNPESFLSCSHGAGRRMGRREASRKFGIDQVLAGLKQHGIEIAAASLKDLPEEATDAYKDINTVMKQQADLVEIEIKLTPLGVVKG
ncbi:MAG: RtcB family protein [bacterium]|nr:RtcB family protein [bacterium]